MDSRRFRELQKLSPQYSIVCVHILIFPGERSIGAPSFLKRSLNPIESQSPPGSGATIYLSCYWPMFLPGVPRSPHPAPRHGLWVGSVSPWSAAPLWKDVQRFLSSWAPDMCKPPDSAKGILPLRGSLFPSSAMKFHCRHPGKPPATAEGRTRAE